MEVTINRERNLATFRISREGWEHPDKFRLLKHEVLHLVVDPIREEHDFQMDALQTDRQAEYRKRHLREIEKVVEHLSYVW